MNPIETFFLFKCMYFYKLSTECFFVFFQFIVKLNIGANCAPTHFIGLFFFVFDFCAIWTFVFGIFKPWFQFLCIISSVSRRYRG